MPKLPFSLSRDRGPAAGPCADGALFPALEPRESATLATGGVHRVHFLDSGHSDGLSVLCVHGGPGSGLSPRQRRHFDPQRFRILQLDQRGCGRSEPLGETAENTLDDLIGDMERLRAHLGIQRWLLFGGSWGATLAMAYAARHPERCTGLILRGSFLASAADLHWFLEGAGSLLPDRWQRFAGHVAECEADAILSAYRHRLGDPDQRVAGAAAVAWIQWESALDNPAAGVPHADRGWIGGAREIARCRILTEYLARRCDLPDHGLLPAIERIADAAIPVALIHGRLDLVCRPENAWTLHHRLPMSRLAWVEGEGHNPFTGAMTRVLRSAIDAWAADGHFARWRDGRVYDPQGGEVSR